eukprot:MONOS_11505.1-p1 / transcript=MONOS_11505.1 / gene=MONOS_11505 / organism=Monocercomonoides_exilis_PA203 / gene_product=unspecified product / transcript_product=unspecified product / location=Mono_scaffold00581:18954-21026(-) / protein_length=531 / sequence_SO=supercontig / SO=protein_coding / is_pseudo=false
MDDSRAHLFTAKLNCEAIFRLHASTLTKIAEHKAGRSINSVRFSPNGKQIALALSGGEVQVIDLKGNKLQEKQIHQGTTVLRKKLHSDEKSNKGEDIGKSKAEPKNEEHCFDVAWIDDDTIVSGGTDEMIFVWEKGVRDSLTGIGRTMNFSTINSLHIQHKQSIVARCSTCLISFDLDRSERTGIVMKSCLGTRLAPDEEATSHQKKINKDKKKKKTEADGEGEDESDEDYNAEVEESDDNDDFTMKNKPVFLENGYQIRGGMSPDEKFYLCPSSKNPWNGQSCTLLLDESLECVMATLLLPGNDISIVASFCPHTLPLNQNKTNTSQIKAENQTIDSTSSAKETQQSHSALSPTSQNQIPDVLSSTHQPSSSQSSSSLSPSASQPQASSSSNQSTPAPSPSSSTLPNQSSSCFPASSVGYLFAIGTTTTLLIYSSLQIIPLMAIKTDSPVVDLVWGSSKRSSQEVKPEDEPMDEALLQTGKSEGESEAETKTGQEVEFVVALCLDGRVMCVTIPSFITQPQKNASSTTN